MGQEFAKVGTTGAQFLKIDIGARSMGMSGVNQLIRGDVEALYQNPAGLAWATKPQAMLSHTKWLADMPYSAVAAMYPVKNIGVIGAFVGHLSSGDIEETTVEQQDGTGKMVSTGHTVMGIGYGRQLTDKFTVGGVLKYVSERLDDVNSNALSVDVGISYDIGIKGVSLGMAIRNFGAGNQIERQVHPLRQWYCPDNRTGRLSQLSIPLDFQNGNRLGNREYRSACDSDRR